MTELDLKNFFILIEHYGENSIISSFNNGNIKKILFESNIEKSEKIFNNVKKNQNVCSKKMAENNLKINSSVSKKKYHSLTELYSEIENFECDLKKFSKNTVLFDGDKNSKIMIVGEGPGAEEDELGKPFVGQSGKLLNLMFSSIGLIRENLYITNVVNWRPPGNRTPTDDEINLFRHFLFSHVSLVNPKIILLLGGTALKAFFYEKVSLSSMRNKVHDFLLPDEYKNKSFKIIVTFHPSYLLRSPSQKSFAYMDMLLLKKTFENL